MALQMDSRKSREILARKSVAISPLSPMSRLGLRAFFKTDGQSSNVIVSLVLLVSLTGKLFLVSVFFFFFLSLR